MKLPFLSKNNANTDHSSRALWPWPAYCQQPRTLSFSSRTSGGMLKTINPGFLDATKNDVVDSTTPESWFTNSCELASFSTASDDQSGAGESIETVIKGLRSERLFFKPGETNSILEEAKAGGEFPFKESVVLSMESQDPYLDFKKSMEEMVEAHGLTDWEGLEELLYCYLKVNGKSNHGYIIGAFVDLLVGLAMASSSSSSSSSSTITTASTTQHHHDSPSSPLSFYTSASSDDSSSTLCCVSSLGNEVDITSPCLTSLQAENEIKQY
ncbi:PREDICTED: transcription repressor OFP13-like [Populus euphratica]|uniref:Transcription repressor n=1 Tax=Populus euphratica TaxID=75702 RepID=A0AAJ6VAU5_POPEU|nr:PREDICTED: transcription repressor OFP13-like [Populus euphratica]